jgi:hypothetical protein
MACECLKVSFPLSQPLISSRPISSPPLLLPEIIWFFYSFLQWVINSCLPSFTTPIPSRRAKKKN